MSRFLRLLACCPAVLFVQCATSPQEGQPEDGNPDASTGTWVFTLSDSVEAHIPGRRTGTEWSLNNGEETLQLQPAGDGCALVPIFEGTLCLGPDGKGTWTDVLRTGDEAYAVPVRWERESTAERPEGNAVDSATWRLAFGEKDPWYGDLVVRTFHGGAVEGTIETATGDFRFLHGREEASRLVLQTFDGAHLFHFSASTRHPDSLLSGLFSSGNHFSTPFKGHRKGTGDAALSDGMTADWTGGELAYSGRNLVADSVHWQWDRSDGKIHILSVMGSWCPNCLDEHRMLKDILRDHPDVRVHTLAFERGLDRENGEKLALKRLHHYSEEMELWRFEDRWDVILAGPASKSSAQAALPFLDRVVSFPTTIVLHPRAERPWIHSGFNGPATGFKYGLEKAAFERALSGPSESR